MTLGANTFFVNRSADSYCYIGQINYWLTDEQRTRLTASVYTGPNAIFAAPGLAGNFDTHGGAAHPARLEPTLHPDRPEQHGLGRQYPQSAPGPGMVCTPSASFTSPTHWTSTVARNGSTTPRARGPGSRPIMPRSRAGINWHPLRWLEFRPEIRGDFAGAPAFGRNGAHNYRDMLSGGISFLVKF